MRLPLTITISAVALAALVAYLSASVAQSHVTAVPRGQRVLQVHLLAAAHSELEAARESEAASAQRAPATPQPTRRREPPSALRRAHDAAPSVGAQQMIAHDTETASSAPSSSSTSDSQFQRELLEHIARFQHYPDDARQKHIAGVVYVRFALAHDGTVIDAWIQRSSGFTILDQEALDTLRRAQPMPAAPSSLPARVELMMPFDFSLMM
jgi:periplasmic protein TonB